jgi:hypothetical protein
VNRSTLAVLQARSDHKPLPTTTTGAAKSRSARPQSFQPTPTQGHVPEAGVGVAWLLAGALLLAALGLGVLVSFVIPELRRYRGEPAAALPEPAPATAALVPAAPRPPAPARTTSPRVVGYAMVNAEDNDADGTAAALALHCAHRNWSLVEVIHDRRDPARRLIDRPGLVYAVNMIGSRRATGLIVARIRDFTHRVTDLAMLLKWLADADAFLGAADYEFDTTTRAGQGTARAVIDLARWERERISPRGSGRFTATDRTVGADIRQHIAVMHDDGLSFRAIADALNLVGVAAPDGHTCWRTADVKTATEEARTS